MVVFVDVFSRYCMVAMTRSTTAWEVRDAFKKILKAEYPRKPALLSSDGGSEYKKGFKTFCADNGIRQCILTDPNTKISLTFSL